MKKGLSLIALLFPSIAMANLGMGLSLTSYSSQIKLQYKPSDNFRLEPVLGFRSFDSDYDEQRSLSIEQVYLESIIRRKNRFLLCRLPCL